MKPFSDLSFTIKALKVYVDENNLANKGYDVVNYFSTNTAERGNVEFSMINEGFKYYFINTENLKTFKLNPNKYLPQFDGYCAFAVVK